MSRINNALKQVLGFIIMLPSVIHADNDNNLYTEAKKALNRGQWQKFHAYRNRLLGHPLKIYLDYYYLNKQFNQTPDAKLAAYIEENPKSPMAEKLRRKWIVRLAEQEKWSQLLRIYEPTSLKKYQCYYLQAMLMTDQEAKANPAINNLWHSGQEMPENCNVLFKKWLSSKANRDELIWQRFELALKKYQFKLAKRLALALSHPKNNEAQQVLKLYQSPSLITKRNYLNQQNSAEVVSFGLFRLARRNPNLAIKLWKRLNNRYQFNPKQKQRIFQAIALRFALRKDKRSGYWFRKIIGYPLDPVYQEWMIRSALIQRDWELVKQGIEGMPKEQQQLSRWRYWHARALEQLGKKQLAKQEYQSIANTRDYHGFLAASKHSDSIRVKHDIPNYTSENIEKVQNLPGFKRAKLLYQLNHKYESRLELYYLMKHCNDIQQYLITKLVSDWGWDSQALHLTRYAEHKDDLTLRFPLHYQASILHHAKKRGIPPELIYAIIRQESFFIPHARSPVGARGLMQLMPQTAYQTSKQYRLKYNEQDLYNGKRNIELGSAHLNHLHKQLNDNPILVIAAYNAGKRAVNRWLPKTQKMPADIWVETIPFYETRKYVRHVIAYYVVYQQRLGKKPNIDDLMKAI